MDVQVAETGPCRKTLTIRIPPENVQEHVAEVFRTASDRVRIKGFRPGRVPRKVLEKKFGSDILLEAKEQLINSSFERAMREHKLAAVGRPELTGVDDKPLDTQAPLEFQVQVEVRPEFELRDVKGIEVTAHDATVTDEDVAGALQQFAQQKRTLNSVPEPVADGDFVAVDIAYEQDGQIIAERKNVRLNTNIPIAGSDPQDFAAKLRGLEKGGTATVDLTFPDNFEQTEARGQKGQARIVVHDVLRVQAALIDDALAKSHDFADLETMKAELQRRIGEQKARQERRRQEEHLLDVLIGEYTFPLPQSMVQAEAAQQIQRYEERLKEAGVPAEDIDKRKEEAAEEARNDAERRVRGFFLLDAIAKKEKLFVTEGDVEAELRNIAAQNNVTPEQVREHYEGQNMMTDLRLGIMERKVRDFLREHAKIS